MKSKIIVIADSFKDFEKLKNHYEKMLGKNIEIKKIKPSKFSDVKKIIKEDTKKIIKILEKDKNYKILLSKDGNCITTEAFKKIIKEKLHITFIIGGPFGLDEEELEKYINFKLSFGKITMSHLITLIVLLEQLFRVKTIIEGRKYHY